MDLLAQGLEYIGTADRDAALLLGITGENSGLSCIAEKLTCYMEEIERFNPAYGLVKTASREELIVKHILDSLAPLGPIARLLRSSRVPLLADAGSGAGLPGIPLAVCFPGIQVTLIERMGRRAAFLRNAAAVLGLSNVFVAEGELEKTAPPHNQAESNDPGFTVITFRAFHPLDRTLVKSLFRLLVSGGSLAAYKGRREKLEEELTAAGFGPADTESAGTAEIVPLSVPFLNEERHLAVLRQRPGVPGTGPLPHRAAEGRTLFL